jgi:hypothetical protein
MGELEDYRTPDGYGTTIGKCLTFGEIEALLAAERGRCAALCDASAAEDAEIAKFYGGSRSGFEFGGRQAAAHQLAIKIRNLPPQTEGGQP